jgi:hypothetical protein
VRVKVHNVAFTGRIAALLHAIIHDDESGDRVLRTPRKYSSLPGPNRRHGYPYTHSNASPRSGLLPLTACAPTVQATALCNGRTAMKPFLGLGVAGGRTIFLGRACCRSPPLHGENGDEKGERRDENVSSDRESNRIRLESTEH